jgi:hypothetical protein
MYSIYDPKDRIIISLIISTLAIFIANFVIFFGDGGDHIWRIKNKTYQLSSLQNFIVYFFFSIAAIGLFVIAFSCIQIAINWFRRHNSK